MDWNKLFRDFFESDSLEMLAKDGGMMLGCPLLVVDDTFHIVASYVPEGFHDVVFEAALARGEITYEVISVLNRDLTRDSGEGVFQTVQDSRYTRRFSCLTSGGMRVGYLICVDIHAALAALPDELFQRLEAILAKQLFCQGRRNGAYGSTAEEILIHLLDGKFSGPGAFYAQGLTTYLAQYRPSRLALINLGLYHSSNFLDDVLKKELYQAFPSAHPFLYRNDVLVLLNDTHALAAFEPLAGQYRLRVAISDDFGDLYLLPQVYRAVHEVVEYLLTHAAGPFVAYTSQFRDLMLLRQLAQRPDYVHPKIRELDEYDRRHGTQFCLTLYTYFICHHSVQSTCQRLFTHRNTVLYRLRKLKEEFDIAVDAPEDTLPLLLSSALVLLQSHQDQLFVHGFQLDAGAGRTE